MRLLYFLSILSALFILPFFLIGWPSLAVAAGLVALLGASTWGDSRLTRFDR